MIEQNTDNIKNSDQTGFDESQMVDMFQQMHTEDHQPSGEQYLSFTLGNEIYAIDILCVQEIRAWESITRIPNTPEYIKGVINLRGSIVPVIDLRQYFNIGNIEYLTTTVVIVITINDQQKLRQVSIVVDAVSDVIRVTHEEINPPPNYGNGIKAAFIKGLITADVNNNMNNNLQPDTKIVTQKKKNQQNTDQGSMVMLLDQQIIGSLIDSEE